MGPKLKFFLCTLMVNLLEHAFCFSYKAKETSSCYSSLHTLILCSVCTLSHCHSAALVFFLLALTSTYLFFILPLTVCHYSPFSPLPHSVFRFHPPAPQSIHSLRKPQALLSVVKPLSEPLPEESDRQTERNSSRKNMADSRVR